MLHSSITLVSSAFSSKILQNCSLIKGENLSSHFQRLGGPKSASWQTSYRLRAQRSRAVPSVCPDRHRNKAQIQSTSSTQVTGPFGNLITSPSLHLLKEANFNTWCLEVLTYSDFSKNKSKSAFFFPKKGKHSFIATCPYSLEFPFHPFPVTKVKPCFIILCFIQ